MTPVPKPEASVIKDLYKLSELSIHPRAPKAKRGHGDAHRRALEQFLQRLSNTQAENRRPFMINLGGGSAILIGLPRPLAEVEATDKAFYYLLTDLWLSGPAHIFGFPDLLLTLRHPELETYRSIGAVELLIAAIEVAALGTGSGLPLESNAQARSPVGQGIDVMIIHNGVDDHAHRASMIQADPETPVLAAEPAVSVIVGWNHFSNVFPIPDSHIGNKAPLPRWLGVMRLPTAEPSPADVHGTLISFASTSTGRPEGILFAPHGIEVQTVEAVLVGSPVLRMLALLHPVNETVASTGDGSIGVDSGLEVYRGIEAKYWVRIDDSDLDRTGLVAPLLEFRERSLEEALEANPGLGPNFRPRVNGDIFVFE